MLSASATIQPFFFKANPGGSTFTDASTFSIVNGDLGKLFRSQAAVAAIAAPSGATASTWWSFTATDYVQVDGSGNIYVALASGGTQTVTTAAGQLIVEWVY